MVYANYVGYKLGITYEFIRNVVYDVTVLRLCVVLYVCVTYFFKGVDEIFLRRLVRVLKS